MTKTNSDSPRPWEVWYARFNFEGSKGYKFRPVIILRAGTSGMFVMMVTGSTNKLHLENDYLLTDWEAAGLDKPSVARVDRVAHIPFEYTGSIGKIGELVHADKEAIRELLQRSGKNRTP